MMIWLLIFSVVNEIKPAFRNDNAAGWKRIKPAKYLRGK